MTDKQEVKKLLNNWEEIEKIIDEYKQYTDLLGQTFRKHLEMKYRIQKLEERFENLKTLPQILKGNKALDERIGILVIKFENFKKNYAEMRQAEDILALRENLLILMNKKENLEETTKKIREIFQQEEEKLKETMENYQDHEKNLDYIFQNIEEILQGEEEKC